MSSPRDRDSHRNGKSYGMASVLGMVTVLRTVIVQGLGNIIAMVGLTIGPLMFIAISSDLHISNLGQTYKQTNRQTNRQTVPFIELLRN